MTKKRKTSFFEDDKEFTHANMAEPFDNQIRDSLVKCAKKLNINYHTNKTVVTIEGLRFSTKAESHLWRSWGADIINMSTVPEVCLAKELNIPYQSIALSTDYDSWNDEHESVTFEMVVEQVRKNIKTVKELLNLYFNE
jgi:5'-methylthioadenosine phosphorylase